MIQRMSALFIVLLIINIITIENTQAQSMSSSTSSGTSTGMRDLLQARNNFNINKIQSDSSTSTSISVKGNEAAKDNGIKILGIDSTAFPKIKANILIDKLCAMSGNLKKDDFKVKEDDNDVAIDNVYFSGNASGQKIDLAIVFDETTSMDEEIDALKSKVKDLTQKINSSMLDARYSLVTFNGADVTTKINWTNDADSFRNVISKLSTSGGNTQLPENSIDGIERVFSFGFRPDAQKVIIVVTDEPSQQKGDGKSSSAYTMDDVKSDLLISNVMLIAVSPDFRKSNVDPNVPRSNLPMYADMRELGDEASGLWIDINSADFSTILKKIQGILTGMYVIEYTSSDQAPSENRTVFISVDAPGCLKGSASSFYTTPGSGPEASQGALSISVRIFDDSNGDGVKGTDEAGLEGWDVQLERPDGNSATAKTDRKGYYIFTGLLPGSYGLVAVAQGNWTTTVPADGIKAIDLVDTHESEIDFGFKSKSTQNNAPPVINNLTSNKTSPQYNFRGSINWTADATDPDGDQILYRFFLNGTPMTDWMTEKNWTWDYLEDPFDTGVYRIEVQVKDGKRAGPDEIGDRRSVSFIIKYDDDFRLVQPTSDGGYVLAGTAEDIGNPHEWLVKTDAEGNILWVRTYGTRIRENGSSNWEGERYDIKVVRQTSDGGYILAGQSATVSCGGLLLKTDAEGNTLWEKRIHGEKTRECNGIFNSVQETSDGGYILAGNVHVRSPHPSQIPIDDTNPIRFLAAWLVKTDGNGNKLWDKTFINWTDSAAIRSDGLSVQQTSDGGYILAGVGVRNPQQDDVATLVKTDENGNKLWERNFWGPKQDNIMQPWEYAGGETKGYSVYQNNDGSYILIAVERLEQGSLLMFKIDANGDVLSRKTIEKNYFAIDEYFPYSESSSQTSDSGYIILAYVYNGSSRDVLIVKTDAEGNELWNNTFSNRDGYELYSVRPTSDGGYVLAGNTRNDNDRPDNAWLVKTDAKGNILWDRTYASLADRDHQTTNAWVVETDAEGNILWDRTYGE